MGKDPSSANRKTRKYKPTFNGGPVVKLQRSKFSKRYRGLRGTTKGTHGKVRIIVSNGLPIADPHLGKAGVPECVELSHARERATGTTQRNPPPRLPGAFGDTSGVSHLP